MRSRRESARHARGRVELGTVTLPVVDGKAVAGKAFHSSNSEGHCGIEAT